MPHCSAIKKDGSRCVAWAVHGHDKCIWHTEKDIKREIFEKPLSRGQQIIIISRNIKSLQRSKGPPLEKAREIRGLISLLRELQGERPPGNDNVSDPLEAKLEKWRKTQT